MKIEYIPRGVCASKIIIDVEDDIVKNVEFEDGCPGNLMGMSILVKGLHVSEVIERLEGISCGRKSTSCPDQLVKALKENY